jgi:hypothetical protein
VAVFPPQLDKIAVADTTAANKRIRIGAFHPELDADILCRAPFRRIE